MKSLMFFIILLICTTNTSFAAGYIKNEQGIMVWSNAKSTEGETFKWSGKTVDGYIQGNGVLEVYRNEKLTYTLTGSFQKGKATGKGTVDWPNKNKYEGDFKNGDRNGKGTLIFAFGTKYEGDWKDDEMTGKGVYT